MQSSHCSHPAWSFRRFPKNYFATSPPEAPIFFFSSASGLHGKAIQQQGLCRSDCILRPAFTFAGLPPAFPGMASGPRTLFSSTRSSPSPPHLPAPTKPIPIPRSFLALPVVASGAVGFPTFRLARRRRPFVTRVGSRHSCNAANRYPSLMRSLSPTNTAFMRPPPPPPVPIATNTPTQSPPVSLS